MPVSKRVPFSSHAGGTRPNPGYAGRVAEITNETENFLRHLR
jgi:hypothetical protein